MLIPHIIIALSTVGFAGLTLIKPTKAKLYSSYLLTVATFITGGYLVAINPSHLVGSCITGLAFLGVVGGMLFAARNRFSRVAS